VNSNARMCKLLLEKTVAEKLFDFKDEAKIGPRRSEDTQSEKQGKKTKDMGNFKESKASEENAK
jgi:hypothetical protein